MALKLPSGIVHESRRFLSMVKDRMTFELRYEFADETLVSKSELRFSSRNDIEERLSASGLRLDKVLGDWVGSRFDEKSSQEIIFFAHSA